MKRKLLYLTTILLFSATIINAQTTTWNFSNNTVSGTVTVASPAFPTGGVLTSASGGTAGTSPNTINVGGLNLYGQTSVGASAFAVITGSNQTFSDGYVGSNRASTGGGGGAASGSFLPTVRYFTFNVSGPCTVKVWIKHTTGVPNDPIATPPTTRTLLVTNGNASYGSGSITNDSSANLHNIVTANVTNAGLVYIYGDNSVAIYKIEVSGATLSADDFQKETASNVFSNGQLVFVSDVKSDTKVDVYGISGVLVKSFTTGSDTSFDLNTGLYVVKSKSAEGEKTAKVLIN